MSFNMQDSQKLHFRRKLPQGKSKLITIFKSIHPPSLLVLRVEVGEEDTMATWELQEYNSVYVQPAREVVFDSQFKTLKDKGSRARIAQAMTQ